MVGSPFWIPPEMVLQKPHGYPADIWSFGICLLELANRKREKDALRYLFNVAVGEVPTLHEPDRWSEKFRSFLGQCLVRDPSARGTAEQLLEHPFIKSAANNKVMRNVLSAIFLQKQLVNNNLI